MSNPQDLRFVRTNQLLVQAFTELLSCKKFEDITVNELCEKAMIRRATFYTHFLDKYDFFAFFVHQQRSSFTEAFSATDNSSMNELFLHMSRQFIHYFTEHMTLVQNVLESSAFPVLISILSEQMRAGLMTEYALRHKEKENAGINPETLVCFYSGGLMQLIHRWVKDKNRMSEEEVMEQINRFMQNYPWL